MSVIDMFAMTAAGLAAEVGKKCIFGSYCGSACPASTNSRRPSNHLDGYCWEHDLCLYNPAYEYAPTECGVDGLKGLKCACDRKLAASARGHYNYWKRCSWWQVWCVETYEVAAAWAIAKAMDLRVYCGSC